jgi:hypothetical protein
MDLPLIAFAYSVFRMENHLAIEPPCFKRLLRLLDYSARNA